VRNWLDRGELAAVRIGSRRVRIRQSDLDRFIAAGSTREPAEKESELRAALDARLKVAQQVLRGGDDSELWAALRSLANAASRLARAIDRSPRV
jgi:hypothetical protein